MGVIYRPVPVTTDVEIAPIPDGLVPIRDQAELRRMPVPVGKTVGELRELGFATDLSWPACAVLVEEPRSPTGYCVRWPTDWYFLDYKDVCWALVG